MNGAYYEKFTSGQGLDLFERDGRTLGFWYTFHEGANRWFTFTGTTGSTFNLHTTVGGTFRDPTTRKVIHCGTVELRDGLFLYDTPEIYGRGAIEIQLLAASNDPRSGSYYEKATVGSGLSVQYWVDGRASVFFYTYGNNGQQRWFSCQGIPSDLTIYEIKDGRFNYPSGEVVPVGKAIFTGTEFLHDLSGGNTLKNLIKNF